MGVAAITGTGFVAGHGEPGRSARLTVMQEPTDLTGRRVIVASGDDGSIAKVAVPMPLERMGTPIDIAQACLFVASAAASWVSGANFEVHGGGEKVAYLDATDVL
jgi:NAD(P)-dependent dehydrogenase (short-subunit alcohol dehydrogenase family)